MERDVSRDMQVLPVGTRRAVARAVVGATVFVAHSVSAGAMSHLSSALVASSEGDVTLEASTQSLVFAQSHSIEPSR
jgi:hypothetical protein